MGLLDLEIVKQPDDVLDQLHSIGVLVRRRVRQTVSAHVECDHLEILRQKAAVPGGIQLMPALESQP